MKVVTTVSGCKQIHTSENYPQGDGQVERWHRTLKAGLHCIAEEKGLRFEKVEEARWDVFVSFVAACHNRRQSRRIGMSPNNAYCGREHRTPLDIAIEDIIEPKHGSRSGLWTS